MLCSSRRQYRDYIVDLYGVKHCTVSNSNCVMPSLSCLLSFYTIPISLRTHQATKVKKIVAFSLKLCRSRATALPALYGNHAVGHFLSVEYACALLKATLTVGRSLVSIRSPRVLSVSSADFMPLTFIM